MRLASIVIIAALALAACISTGRDFDISKIGMIQKNVTKRSQIQGWFGYPYMTGVDNGDPTWIYNYTKGGAGGTQTKNLYIVFGKEGTVTSFTFSTSFPDEIASTK